MQVTQALSSPNRPNLREVNALLDHFREAPVVDGYLMDTRNTLALSNRNAPYSFVGVS